MKRLDILNDRIFQIYTILLRIVNGKCTCFLVVDSSKNNVLVFDHQEEKGNDEEWMTINEALVALKITRRTLFNLRKKGYITSREQGRSVRLLKSDVMEAVIWYSIPKGRV